MIALNLMVHVFFFSGTAYAQCPLPSGNDASEGVLIYNSDHKVMQYCNGDGWVGIWGGGGGSGSGLTPAGAVMAFDLTSCPEGWSEYLPARGRFMRGIDNGAGNDPEGTRAPGHVQADALGSHTHTGTAASAGAHTHTGTTNSAGDHSHTLTLPGRSGNSAFVNRPPAWGYDDWAGSTQSATTSTSGAHTHTLSIDSAGTHTHSLTINAAGADETRPKNVALLYCRKD